MNESEIVPIIGIIIVWIVGMWMMHVITTDTINSLRGKRG